MSSSKTFMFVVLIIMSSCNSQNSGLKSSNLQDEFETLKTNYKKLVFKNDSLVNALNIIKKEYGLDRQVNDESDKILLKYKLELKRVKAGYLASDYENLFLPAITLEFKNLSQNDLSERITFHFAFINNTTGEQLYDNIQSFTGPYEVLIGGLTKKVTMKSIIGWSAIQKQNVSVRLYINDQFYKQYKIENTEYFERL